MIQERKQKSPIVSPDSWRQLHCPCVCVCVCECVYVNVCVYGVSDQIYCAGIGFDPKTPPTHTHCPPINHPSPNLQDVICVLLDVFVVALLVLVIRSFA